ncbi:MAG: AIR synthase family protein [Saccharofermentanales bacterium]
MDVGKLTNEDLKKIVLERLPICSTDISKGPSVGLDSAVIRSRDGMMVISSDPVTGASNEVGSIAIHVSCNDIACAGVKPAAIMLVVIAPASATREELITVIDQASQTAKNIGVDIIGGHTEVSDAVNRFILMTTAFGYQESGNVISAAGAKTGDTILMTKYAAMEGTAILATDFEKRLSTAVSIENIEKAKKLISEISVVEEGVICGILGVHAMHDATEGGIMGAVWEITEASHTGCLIDLKKIPVLTETRKICDLLDLDPYRLISSGSMIIITDKPEKVIESLAMENIKCTGIGKITAKSRQFKDLDGRIKELMPPGADELYKIK